MHFHNHATRSFLHLQSQWAEFHSLSMFDIPVLEARAHGGVRTIVAPDSLTVVNSEVIIFKCRNVFLL